MSRTVIIGMSDPYSDDPEHALSACDPNSSGFRLYRMLWDVRPGVTPQQYEAAFERVNLLTMSEAGGGWDSRRAEFKVRTLDVTGRRVILCGNAVSAAFRVKSPALEWVRRDRTEFVRIPHPSGLTRDYNDPLMREAVGELLAAEYGRRDR